MLLYPLDPPQSRHGVGGRTTPHMGPSASTQPQADGHTDRRLPQLKTLQEQTQIPAGNIECVYVCRLQLASYFNCEHVSRQHV